MVKGFESVLNQYKLTLFNTAQWFVTVTEKAGTIIDVS